jgi:hypothetical protein
MDYLFPLSREKENAELMCLEWITQERELLEGIQEEMCPCGQQHIKELCWIKNRLTGNAVFVGNECIRHFGNGIGDCMRCGLYPAVSHSAHYCEFCGHNRNNAPTGKVKSGKYKGLLYSEVPQHYGNWALENPKFVDPHYLFYFKKKRQQAAETYKLEQMRRKRSQELFNEEN